MILGDRKNKKTYVKLLYFHFLLGVMAQKKLYTFYMSPYGALTKHVVKMASLHGSTLHGCHLNSNLCTYSIKKTTVYAAVYDELLCEVTCIVRAVIYWL